MGWTRESMHKFLILLFLLPLYIYGGDEKEEISETNHTLFLNEKEVKYKAVAGTLLVKNEKGEPKGNFFYISYTKEDEKGNRPITFCFNGGPGSSSVWLHLGVLGPKKVEIKPGEFNLPPYHFVDNPYCFLDLTDLVFIDPISTGYSLPASGEEAKQFYGLEEDIDSIAKFIRLYTTRFNRWESPKFLIGESYGTTRATGLAQRLMDVEDMYINGIVLVSSVLNFQTLDKDTENELYPLVYLPSYAAVAQHHGKLDPTLQKLDLKNLLNEVENFAFHTYSQVLLQGDELPPSEREKIVEKLVSYTGLPKSFVAKSNLRICVEDFRRELLKDQNRFLGRFDGRQLGIASSNCGESNLSDPSLDAVYGLFTGAFYAYVRNDLKWEKEKKYFILTTLKPWNWGKQTEKNLNLTDTLRKILTDNPKLKVYVASGYYDLATPFFGTIYTFQHLNLDPTLKENITMGFYKGGHMIYLSPDCLEQFKSEVGNFISNTLLPAKK